MEQPEEKVKVVKTDAKGEPLTGKAAEEREMTKTQFAYIGDDATSNGGWKLSKPKEIEETPELIAARARYEELHPGEKAGRKSLNTLQEAIAKASHPNE